MLLFGFLPWLDQAAFLHSLGPFAQASTVYCGLGLTTSIINQDLPTGQSDRVISWAVIPFFKMI